MIEADNKPSDAINHASERPPAGKNRPVKEKQKPTSQVKSPATDVIVDLDDEIPNDKPIYASSSTTARIDSGATSKQLRPIAVDIAFEALTQNKSKNQIMTLLMENDIPEAEAEIILDTAHLVLQRLSRNLGGDG